MALMQHKSYAERFSIVPPLDLMTMMFVTQEACKRDPDATEKLKKIEIQPSELFNLSLTQLETYTKICVQEGIIPKEPYEECIKIRGRLFNILLTYGDDDLI